MIEIIVENVEMPTFPSQRKFIKTCVGNNWEVLDSENNNTLRYKGSFEDASLVCHNLNKKHYRDLI